MFFRVIPQDLSKIESKEEKENLIGLLDSIQNINREFLPVKSYINCDLRYFNFNFLVEKIGFFDSNIFIFFSYKFPYKFTYKFLLNFF